MSDAKPKRVSSGSRKGGNQTQYGTFVRCDLTTEDKHRLGQREFDPGRVFDQIHSLVEVGYKFSVSLQSDKTSYIASLYDRDAESKTNGYTLTGRGRSVPNAIDALLYKHYDLLDGIWPASGGTDDEWG